MFPAACVSCWYCSPACLPLKLCWGFFTLCEELVHPTFCCCCIYILLCFIIFSRTALDHCPFWENSYWVTNLSSSWKIIIYLPVSQAWRWLWPMWLWRVSDRVGLSWDPFKTCALFDVPGMQMAPHQRIRCPDELQQWLEWCPWRWRTAKPLFHYRKWPFCSHPMFSDRCVSLSFTADCLKFHPCAHLSDSAINRHSLISLKMTQWLSVSYICNRILTVGGGRVRTLDLFVVQWKQYSFVSPSDSIHLNFYGVGPLQSKSSQWQWQEEKRFSRTKPGSGQDFYLLH